MPRKGTLCKSGASVTTQTQFFGKRGSECLGLAVEPNLYIKMRDINKCKDLEMLKFKVPVRFLGTIGFSPRWEGQVLPYAAFSKTSLSLAVFVTLHSYLMRTLYKELDSLSSDFPS